MLQTSGIFSRHTFVDTLPAFRVVLKVLFPPMSSLILRSLGSWIVAHSLVLHIFMQLGIDATMYCMFSSAVRITPVLRVPLSRSGPPAEWYVSMKSCKYSCAVFA